MKKILKSSLIALMVATVATSVACDTKKDSSSAPEEQKIEYQKFVTNTIGFNDNSDPTLEEYNSQLYYLNQWEKFESENIGFPDMGDPFILYHEGYYYAYGTRGAQSFHCFRSEDLTHWTRLADCFTPLSDSWGRYDLWAPDIQQIDGKWYLYYTARCVNADGSRNCQIGVAVADHPAGPFVQFTGENANGEEITLERSSFTGLEGHTILDSTVFQDDDGSLYMYFSYDARTGSSEMRERAKDDAVAEIWGVKLKDPVTWDLSTLTPLICPGYKNLQEEYPTISWERWSPSFDPIAGVECAEGPYMIKHNGTYYLTYCANSFVDCNYAVGYAVSDTPLGNYDKPKDYYLQNMILGVPSKPGEFLYNRYQGFTTGTGHAAIFKTASGELMFAYHAHYNRAEWNNGDYRSDWRALAIDYLYFDEKGTPYANGPTYALTRTPEDISGYKDMIHNATVKAECENVNYLTDNFTNRAYNTKEVAREATFSAGTRSIEITFENPVTVKAINVYNSYDRSLAIEKITQIDFGQGRGIVNACFNERYLSKRFADFINPHSAFNIELDDELVTNRIVITVTSEFDFALGEIEIIGK